MGDKKGMQKEDYTGPRQLLRILHSFSIYVDRIFEFSINLGILQELGSEKQLPFRLLDGHHSLKEIVFLELLA